MPNVTITIGTRDFEVACQDGEEHFLRSAAQLLDNEASVLVDQVGRMPETRMLLMAGLMLADKTAGMEEQLRAAETRNGELQAQIQAMKSAPPPEPAPASTIPAEVSDTLEAIAERAEALVDQVKSRTRG